MRLIPYTFVLLIVAIVFEIVGSETGYKLLQPTYIFEVAGSYISRFAAFCATLLVWISDVLRLIKDIWQLIADILEPLYTKVVTAGTNIITKFFGQLIINPIHSFYSTYKEQLLNAYNQFSTVLISMIWFYGGIFIVLIGMEIYGIVNKYDKIRPSKYIAAFANYLYNEFYSLGYLWVLLCDMFGILNKIITWLNIYFKPYIDKISEASGYIWLAITELLASPSGFFNGFLAAIYNAKFYVISWLVTISAGLYFLSYYVPSSILFWLTICTGIFALISSCDKTPANRPNRPDDDDDGANGRPYIHDLKGDEYYKTLGGPDPDIKKPTVGKRATRNSSRNSSENYIETLAKSQVNTSSHIIIL